MEKVTFTQLNDIFYEHNKSNNVAQFQADNVLYGLIRFKQGPWFNAEYTDIERTYTFSCANKYFMPNMSGNSLFADCLDGNERRVRLDWYLPKWEIDFCAIVTKEGIEKIKQQS